jgi:hypothetical protein
MPPRVLPLLALPLAALSGCETVRDLNPIATRSPYESHCRRALDALVAGDTDKQRPSIEDMGQRERIEGDRSFIAVTIVYVQGDSRRLMSCLYAPGVPGNAAGISYRGEGLSRARVDQVNAAVARR